MGSNKNSEATSDR